MLFSNYPKVLAFLIVGEFIAGFRKENRNLFGCRFQYFFTFSTLKNCSSIPDLSATITTQSCKVEKK